MHYGLEQGWPFSWTLKGLLHMAVLMPRYSPTLLTYFLFPSMAPSGNYFDTTETSSPAIMLALAQVGSPMGEGQGPPSSPSNPSGWQEGTKAQGCRPAWATWATGEPAPGTLGTLGPPRKGSHGGSGSHLLRFRRGLVTSSHPSEGGNKLLHLKTKRGAGGGWGGHCTQLMVRTARLLRGKRCTLMCLERWSLRANFFSHTGHWYGFTPE